MPDSINEKESAIAKIVQDPIFATSDPYRQLLEYLFTCYKQNYKPTEIEIAIHVFDKKEDFDPIEDTLVRVYFYRLRKKLDEYYAGSGKYDSLRMIIPKGHHIIEFADNTISRTGQKFKFNLQTILLLFVFIILVITIVYLWLQNRDLKKAAKENVNFADRSIIWADFVNSTLNTSVVIGELFSFYMNKSEYNHEWLIRDDQINSFEELQSFIDVTGLNQDDIYLPGWDIVPKSSISNLLNIYHILNGNQRQLDVKITSEVTLENIRENNIIYIGHFHNLKHLSKYLPNQRFHPYTAYIPGKRHPERHIRVTAAGIDTVYQFTFQYGQQLALSTDYVVLSKVPGPNNNMFLFIVSFLPLGRLESIKMLSDENLHAHLFSEIQSISEDIPPFFELLIEVKGYEEKGFESKVKHFFPLP
jgi:hypothetical protein